MSMTLSPRMFRFGRLFMVSWLAFLILPISAILGDHFSQPEQITGLSLLAGIAVVYAWFWLRVIGRDDRPMTIASLVVFTALMTWFTLATPPQYGSLFVTAAFMAGAAFEWRVGVPVVVAITGLAVGCDIVRGYSVGGDIADFINDLLVGLTAVGGRLLLTAYQQLSVARERIAQLAVDEERLRFARDLHDLLGHSLSVIALKSELAGRLVSQSPGLAKHEIKDLEQVARQALREVRDAVAGYRQPTLATELAGACAALSAAGIDCRVDQQTGALPPAVEAVLAWAVREGATNVIRHSGAQRCSIRVHSNNGRVQVDVVDDGRGGDSPAGSGLLGLEERVQERSGRLEAEALPHEGFRLRVTLPLADKT